MSASSGSCRSAGRTSDAFGSFSGIFACSAGETSTRSEPLAEKLTSAGGGKPRRIAGAAERRAADAASPPSSNDDHDIAER